MEGIPSAPGEACAYTPLIVPRVSTPVRNGLGYAVPELFYGMTFALTIEGPMVAAYRDAFGGGEQFVGLVWLAGSLSIGIAGLFSALWVEPLQHKRAFVFWGHIGTSVTLLLTALAIWLGAAHSSAAACAIYVVGTSAFFLTIGLLIPAWLGLIGELFRKGSQARVLGLTFLCNKASAIVGGQLIVRLVLGSGWSAVDEWSLLFAIAGVAAFIGSFPFLWVVEEVRPRPARKRFAPYLRSLVAVLRELPLLRRFILADVIGITAMITLAFYADAAIHDGGFERSWAGHWVAVGAVAQVIISGLVAWRGSRIHPRTWFVVGTAAGIVATLAAAYGSSGLAASYGGLAYVYDVAAAGAGIYMGIRAICHAPMVMGLAPGRDGTAPIGIAVALLMLVQGFGPAVAGVVISGWGYLPVFGVVALCGAISLIFLLLWVPRDVESSAP
jgi:hypothetical protein